MPEVNPPTCSFWVIFLCYARHTVTVVLFIITNLCFRHLNIMFDTVVGGHVFKHNMDARQD